MEEFGNTWHGSPAHSNSSINNPDLNPPVNPPLLPGVNDLHVRDLLNNLNSRLESLEVTPRHTSVLMPKVALPEKFSGNISQCRKFISSVENVFVLQSNRYVSSEVKTRFIGTLLTGDALTWFSGVVDSASNQGRRITKGMD